MNLRLQINSFDRQLARILIPARFASVPSQMRMTRTEMDSPQGQATHTIYNTRIIGKDGGRHLFHTEALEVLDVASYIWCLSEYLFLF